MKKFLMVWASVFALLPAGQAVAQQAAPPPADGVAESEDVIVVGIRRSLQQAADIKRNAPQIEDVITAEDVGKLPDANVAEALQRVTGVQITRVFGEGQAVNIRGMPPVGGPAHVLTDVEIPRVLGKGAGEREPGRRGAAVLP